MDVALTQRDFATAKHKLDELRQREPSDELSFFSARYSAILGENDRAIIQLEEYLHSQHSDPEMALYHPDFEELRQERSFREWVNDHAIELLKRKRHKRGSQLLEYLQSRSPRDGGLLVSLACAKAQAGLEDEALRLLRKAIRLGFQDVGAIAFSSQLDPLRSRPEFREALSRLKNKRFTDWSYGYTLRLPSDDWYWLSLGTPSGMALRTVSFEKETNDYIVTGTAMVEREEDLTLDEYLEQLLDAVEEAGQLKQPKYASKINLTRDGHNAILAVMEGQHKTTKEEMRDAIVAIDVDGLKYLLILNSFSSNLDRNVQLEMKSIMDSFKLVSIQTTVRLVCAHIDNADHPPGDPNPDPVIVVERNGTNLFASATIDDSFHPVWRTEFNAYYAPGDTIKLEVYDEDSTDYELMMAWQSVKRANFGWNAPIRSAKGTRVLFRVKSVRIAPPRKWELSVAAQVLRNAIRKGASLSKAGQAKDCLKTYQDAGWKVLYGLGPESTFDPIRATLSRALDRSRRKEDPALHNLKLRETYEALLSSRLK